MASNVELSSNTDTTQLVKRANVADSRAAFAEMQRINSLVQDGSSDHTADVKQAANVISATVQNLQQAAKNGDPTASAQLSKLQDGVSKLNNMLHASGSDLRLAFGSTGVTVSSVNVSGQMAPSTSTQAQPWTNDLTQDSTGPGLNMSGSSDKSVQDSPLFSIIKEAIEDVLKQALGGQAGGASDSSASDASDSTDSTASTADTSAAGTQGTTQDTSAAQGTGASQGTSAAQGTGASQGTSATQGTGASQGTSVTQGTGASQGTSSSQGSSSSAGQASGGGTLAGQATSAAQGASSSAGQGAGATSSGGLNATAAAAPSTSSSSTGGGSALDQLNAMTKEAQLGEGQPGMQGLLSDNFFSMFMDALKKAADQKNGKDTKKNGKGAANVKGNTQQQSQGLGGLLGGGSGAGAGSGTGTSTQQQANPTGTGTGTGVGAPNAGNGATNFQSNATSPNVPGNPGSVGQPNGDNFPISNAGGSDVPDSSGAAGDPMLCNANINGILMMVLMECYKDGQKDLLAQAQRMQDINNQKKGIRSELAADRQTLASNPNDANASAAEQDQTDQLQSLGDDSQMMQLNLQNMAQNQQQLLQMISNFSKNTHDNSMAIIRHIGGG